MKGDNMSSLTKLKVSKKLGLLVAIMLSLMLLSGVVHAGLAPDFTFTDIDGNTHSLSSFRGSVVILEFFEIACGYCANEIGVLETVHNTLGSSLVIISVSITSVDTNDKLKQYRDDNSIPWIVAGAVSGLFSGLYTAPSIPALFIIDGSGNLRYQNDWTASASQLTGEIQGLVGTSNSLTVNTSPGLSGVHFRVDGSDCYTSGGSFSVQLGAGQHQVLLADTTITESDDTQCRFSHWGGIGSGSLNPIQVEVSGLSTLEADFDTYYKTVFVQTGSEGTPQVTVDGVSYVLPQTFWFESGSSHSFQYESVSETGIQCVPASTLYTSPITVASPTTITANYKTQYYVTVVSEHGEPTLSQWVDKGSELITTVSSTADDNGAGTRHNCAGYKINEGGLQPGTIYAFENIQAPEEIDFQWTTQYRLTLNASPNCMILQPPGSPSDSWYDAGSSVTYGAQAVNDCRLICWTLDGTSLVKTQLTVTMDNPHTATVGLLPP
ncbi:MAG: redoxin domain-containing protein [Candidatus Bathyarchaeia archaeon]